MYTIEEIIDRAFNSLDGMLGFSSRARNEDGTYRGDDLSTPDTNEAWSSGKKPTRKKSTRKKKASKKQ